MQTSQSAQISCDNAPKKVLGLLKGKCMTKLMKVCIGNNQRIDSWKCASTETLDKKKKTLILLFRCWHYKNKRTKSAEIVWGNDWHVFLSMVFFFIIIYLFKLSICVIAVSSLYLKLRFSPVAPYHSDHWRSFNFKILFGNKMPWSMKERY